MHHVLIGLKCVKVGWNSKGRVWQAYMRGVDSFHNCAFANRNQDNKSYVCVESSTISIEDKRYNEKALNIWCLSRKLRMLKGFKEKHPRHKILGQ